MLCRCLVEFRHGCPVWRHCFQGPGCGGPSIRCLCGDYGGDVVLGTKGRCDIEVRGRLARSDRSFRLVVNQEITRIRTPAVMAPTARFALPLFVMVNVRVSVVFVLIVPKSVPLAALGGLALFVVTELFPKTPRTCATDFGCRFPRAYVRRSTR